MNKKLRIGIMGCAAIAKRLMIPAMIQQNELFEITGIASRTKEKAEDFSNHFNIPAYTGYESLLDPDLNIDIIYMPLPTGLHEEWVIKCLNANKHVLVEKSLASNYQSARKMVQLAKEKGLLLIEDFMFRYHRQHQFVFSKLNSDAFGELRLFRSCFGFPPLKENNFRYDAQLGGGALLDAGAYTVSAARLFLGEELEVTAACLHIDKSKESDVWGNMTLMNNQGQTAQLSFGFDNYYQCNYELWGSKGKIVAERAFTPKPNERPSISLHLSTGEEKYQSEPDNHFANILAEVYRAINSKDFTVHLDHVLNQSRILSAIREKAVYIYH
jgi:predicted dehydrogenase